MPLTIVSVAYALAPVSPGTAGGAEQVLWALDRAIVAAGHRSVVVAQAGSQVAGTLVPTPAPRGTLTPQVRTWVTAAHAANLARACRAWGADLLHFHGIDFPDYRVPSGIPALATLHMPPAWYPERIWAQREVQLQCVSESQRAACPAAMRERLPVIANGVRNEARRRRPAGFALALGRVCPEKNLHAALDAGTLAGVPVVVGGEVFAYPEHQRYFHDEMEPRLARSPHRFLGPVDWARKRRLLAAAHCLLLPTLAPETSSLVAMEAMMAGVPVVAYRSGAVPEIVQQGVTGWLVDSVEEMADAIGRCAEIAPEACQARAQTLFSAERMVDEYLALYARLAAARRHPVAV